MNIIDVLTTSVGNEIKHGTEQSVASVYAVLIGLVHVDDKNTWARINHLIPAKKIGRIKKMAWKKYDALTAITREIA